MTCLSVVSVVLAAKAAPNAETSTDMLSRRLQTTFRDRPVSPREFESYTHESDVSVESFCRRHATAASASLATIKDPMPELSLRKKNSTL